MIQDNPTIYLTSKNGGVAQKDKIPLTDEQVARLLDAIKGLPPYVFVMIGLPDFGEKRFSHSSGIPFIWMARHRI